MKLNASFPRRTRLYALLFSLVLCLTACSAPSDPSGTLSGFSRDGNAFCYPDAQWGMTPSELQKEAGGLATQPDGSGDPDDSLNSYTGALFSKDTVSLSGLTAQASFQFEDGALWAAGLTASGDGSTLETFDALVQEARNAFGDAAQTQENETRELEVNGTPMTVTVSSYQWEREDGDGARTRLMISAVQQSESSVAVSLDVSLLPNA